MRDVGAYACRCAVVLTLPTIRAGHLTQHFWWTVVNDFPPTCGAPCGQTYLPRGYTYGCHYRAVYSPYSTYHAVPTTGRCRAFVAVLHARIITRLRVLVLAATRRCLYHPPRFAYLCYCLLFALHAAPFAFGCCPHRRCAFRTACAMRVVVPRLHLYLLPVWVALSSYLPPGSATAHLLPLRCTRTAVTFAQHSCLLPFPTAVHLTTNVYGFLFRFAPLL